MNLTPPLISITYDINTHAYVVQSVFIHGKDMKVLGEVPTFQAALALLVTTYPKE